MKIKIDCPFEEHIDKITKMNSVQFEDLTPFDNKIIDSFETLEDFNQFRLKLYNRFKTKVRLSAVSKSEDIGGDIIDKQGFKLSSDIISLDHNDIGFCLPYYISRRFYRWNINLHKFEPKNSLFLYL